MANKSSKSNHPMLRISFNSPVVLGFVIICFISLILNNLTNGRSNDLVFVCYRSSLLNPLTYVRLICHVFGHASWAHLIGNMTLLLVVGPLLEEKYGSSDMILLIVTTAILTGIVHMIIFPHVGLLGASGVVFAMIMLSSFASIRSGSIPLTLILVAVIYIGGEIHDALTVVDNVSNLTHILGGFVGIGFGFLNMKLEKK